MAALLTTKNRVRSLIDFRDQPNLYLAIGKNVTEWDDAENPDVPLVTQTEIEELIYIKKITVKHAVKTDDPYDAYGSDVMINGIDYNYVDDDAEIYDTPILKLYLNTEILFSDIAPTDTTFRQIGILLNPKDDEGNLLTDGEYLAADVADQGELLYVNNIVAVTRDSSQTESHDILLNF